MNMSRNRSRGRMVDGHAIARSRKLLDVPKPYRAEYSVMLPHSDLNGNIPRNPRWIWTEAYSFNREDKTLKQVTKILDSFIGAGMLKVHSDENGDEWLYFEGSEKPGRLIEADKRYPCGSPRYPGVVAAERVAKVGQTFNQQARKPEVSDGMEARPGSGNANEQPNSSESIKPNHAECNSGLTEMQSVMDEISLLSDGLVIFWQQDRPIIESLVSEFGPTLVVEAFRHFWQGVDDFSQKFAAKNFVEKAPQLLRTLKLQRSQRDQQAATHAKGRQELEAQGELDRQEARRRRDEQERLRKEAEEGGEI